MARDDSTRENAADAPRHRQPPSGAGDREPSSSRPTRQDWEQLPADPDPERDLGYRIEHWETFRASTDGENVMFLPGNEELLRTEAFLVADAASVCDVTDRI